MEYEIEKDVPMPSPTVEYGLLTSAIGKMEVGDSFLFPLIKRSTAQSSASRIGKELGRSFVRKVDDNSLRIWRVL